MLGGPKLDAVLQVGSHKSEVKGQERSKGATSLTDLKSANLTSASWVGQSPVCHLFKFQEKYLAEKSNDTFGSFQLEDDAATNYKDLFFL